MEPNSALVAEKACRIIPLLDELFRSPASGGAEVQELRAAGIKEARLSVLYPSTYADYAEKIEAYGAALELLYERREISLAIDEGCFWDYLPEEAYEQHTGIFLSVDYRPGTYAQSLRLLATAVLTLAEANYREDAVSIAGMELVSPKPSWWSGWRLMDRDLEVVAKELRDLKSLLQGEECPSPKVNAR